MKMATKKKDKYHDLYIRHAAKLLPILKVGKAVTREAIETHTNGNLVSKYIFCLRKLGFDFQYGKDGKKIVSYTLVKEPKNAADIRAAKPLKNRGEEPVKTVKAKTLVKSPAKKKAPAKPKLVVSNETVAVDKRTETKKNNLAKLKAVATARRSSVPVIKRQDDETENLLGSTGETSFAVDPEFDNIDGIDLSKLV